MLSDKISEELTYVGKEPGVQALRQAYNQTLNELDSYFDLCRTSYDDRRNEWPGKSRDLRKHGSDAFPWEGAADMESHVIDERVTKLVSLFISSMKRANIRAYPVEMGDISRSKVVSNFLKWMVSSGYIPRFTQEMERNQQDQNLNSVMASIPKSIRNEFDSSGYFDWESNTYNKFFRQSYS